jgi:hypothetical protein
MKNAIFWDVAPCRSFMNRRFGRTSVHAGSTRRHILEDDILHEKLVSIFCYYKKKTKILYPKFIVTNRGFQILISSEPLKCESEPVPRSYEI